MKTTILRRTLTLLCAAALLLAACPALAEEEDTVTISRKEYERYRQLDVLLELMDKIDSTYIGTADPETLIRGAAKGLVDALDNRYSFYYTPEEFSKMYDDDAGKFVGIGITISSDAATQICTISRVFKDGPAEQAGVRRGDILYRVGDFDVTADSLNDAVAMMRGKPGTEVTVTFLRDGEPYTVTMTRASVVTNRVDSMSLDSRVGLIVIDSFAGDSAKEFSSALYQLTAKNIDGLIIDLRDNTGGWISAANSIADLFLPYGVMCYMQYKDGSRTYSRTSTDGRECGLPIVVLVNGETASAAEMLAICLRERAGAVIVGMNTYGMGTTNSVISLSDGSGVQLNTSAFYSPNGVAVQDVGITPDLTVPIPEDQKRFYLLGDLADPQLSAAYQTMLIMLRMQPAKEATEEAAPV